MRSFLRPAHRFEHQRRVDDQAIVASIPPDQLAVGLGLMLPAMNIDDRTEMLGGIQAGAPPEVFAGVWALAGAILDGPDYRTLGVRLGIS